jgi:hypothetical protein
MQAFAATLHRSVLERFGSHSALEKNSLEEKTDGVMAASRQRHSFASRPTAQLAHGPWIRVPQRTDLECNRLVLAETAMQSAHSIQCTNPIPEDRDPDIWVEADAHTAQCGRHATKIAQMPRAPFSTSTTAKQALDGTNCIVDASPLGGWKLVPLKLTSLDDSNRKPAETGSQERLKSCGDAPWNCGSLETKTSTEPVLTGRQGPSDCCFPGQEDSGRDTGTFPRMQRGPLWMWTWRHERPKPCDNLNSGS